MKIIIKVEQLSDANLHSIIENDLKMGEVFSFEFTNGNTIDIIDVDAFHRFLKDRKIRNNNNNDTPRCTDKSV